MSLKTRLFLSITLFASIASADSIKLTLTGQVTSTNLQAIAFQDAVTISIVYDSTVAPAVVQNNQAFFANAMTLFSLDVDSYHSSYSSGMFGLIDKADNLVGADGIQFHVAPVLQNVNGVTLAPLHSNGVDQAFQEIFVNLDSNSGSVWSGYSLPTTYTFSDFDQTRNFSAEFQNGGFSGTWTNLTVENLSSESAAPEPGTWMMLCAGLACFLGRRKYQKPAIDAARQ